MANHGNARVVDLRDLLQRIDGPVVGPCPRGDGGAWRLRTPRATEFASGRWRVGRHFHAIELGKRITALQHACDHGVAGIVPASISIEYDREWTVASRQEQAQHEARGGAHVDAAGQQLCVVHSAHRRNMQDVAAQGIGHCGQRAVLLAQQNVENILPASRPVLR
ncbi:MAG: hypothetical protein ABIN37_18720 [Burkholderiaceae bacterium]